MVESESPEYFIRLALEEAGRAARRGEVPVGALVVRGRRILGRGRNMTVRGSDPTAHAEIVAIRKACRKVNNYRLTGCDLYVTLEPCAMCLGAAVQARIERIFYGAPDSKAGAVESVLSFPFERLNHRIEIRGGILAPECSIILKDFFASKRRGARAERWPSG